MLRSVRALLPALLLAGAVSCEKPLTVEQRVIASIRDMEARVEAGENRAFLEHIAEDFTGQQEAMSKDQVHALLIFQLNRHKSLQAQLFPIRVTGAGENAASAVFRALVTGGPGWFPESGQLFEFDTRWVLVDGDWLLHSAHWRPVNLEDAL